MCLTVIQHASYFTELEHFLLGDFCLERRTLPISPTHQYHQLKQRSWHAKLQEHVEGGKTRESKMLQVFVGGTRFFSVLAGFWGVVGVGWGWRCLMRLTRAVWKHKQSFARTQLLTLF